MVHIAMSCFGLYIFSGHTPNKERKIHQNMVQFIICLNISQPMGQEATKNNKIYLSISR